MNIRARILRKNRTVVTKNINPNRGHFRYNNGIYTITKEAVNLTKKNNNVNPTPELIYQEGNPLPIGSTSTCADFLEETVIKNVLRQIAEPKGFFLEMVADYIRNPTKMFIVAIVVIIVATVLPSLMHW